VINPGGSTPFNTNPGFPGTWNAAAYSPGDTVNISVTAYDLDSNTGTDNQNYRLRPEHCCNGTFDPADGEEGTDCGGPCAGCDGAACGTSMSNDCSSPAVDCSANSDRCASNLCVCSNPGGTACQDAGYDAGINDCCLCQTAPVIQWLTPEGGFCDGSINTPCRDNTDCATFAPATCNTNTGNGAFGNLVTIGGRSFGTIPGTIRFSDDGTNWTVAQLAVDVNANCINSWQDDQIIVVVPAGLTVGTSPVVEVAEAVSGNGYFDRTNDDRGPDIDFVINTISRPGLCEVNPTSGQLDDTINYEGIRLQGAVAYFGNFNFNIIANNPSFLNNTSGTAQVPNITAGRTTTFAQNPAGVISNYINFQKLAQSTPGPFITAFEPSQGAPGQYVTIYGGNFGNFQGTSKVHFDDPSVAGPGPEANYNFPRICEDSTWSDTEVIIKVPDAGVANGNYLLTMVVGSETVDTSGVTPATFEVRDTLILSPSLCKIEPIMGPNNSPVSLWGEYFPLATPGVVRFQLNHDQSGGNVGWSVNGDAERADTTVHASAVSGSVKIGSIGSDVCVFNSDCDILAGEECLDTNNDDVLDTCGLVGNSINFSVGLCTSASDPDAACGAVQICCPIGTFMAGRCAAVISDCYADVPSSVFEWQFSTAVATVTPPSILESCSGFNIYQCADAGFCPNSPGQCSTYLGGVATGTGIYCNSTGCNSVIGCSGGSCSYDQNFNRCYETGTVCDLASSSVTTDILGSQAVATCRTYNGAGRWHINTPLSCPDPINAPAWISIPGNICIDTDIGPDSCSVCGSGLSCFDDGDNDAQGLCVANQRICPSGTICNGTECMDADDSACECCCEIGQDARDCCTPLTCEGECGDDRSAHTGTFGYCSGCRIDEDGNGSIEEVNTNGLNEYDLSDQACNCSGHSGKYCDVDAGPDGVCSDCTNLSNNTLDCTRHLGVCCVDNMNSDYCRGGPGNQSILPADAPDIGYCSYYNCDLAIPIWCASSTPGLTGDYRNIDICTNQCADNTPGLPSGLSCYDSNQNNCSLTCDTGLECIGASGCTTSNCGAHDTTCRCCCSPGVGDECHLINPTLVCQPDNSPCTGGDRGLCCGCEEDTDCATTPTDVGCGSDTCCRPRPQVDSIYPNDDAIEICRNTSIKVEFNEIMDIGSFSGNAILFGDYGADQCPANTVNLNLAYQGGRFVKQNKLIKTALNIYKKVISTILPNKIARSFTPPSAVNYCAVRGAVNGRNNVAGNTELVFNPRALLDPGRLYYFMVVGDLDLTSSGGVLNSYGIGLNASVGLPWPAGSLSPSGVAVINNTFNGRDYTNSFIWSFTTLSEQATNNGVCELSFVNIEPRTYLFQTTENDANEVDSSPNDPSFDSVRDSDKVFVAYPRTTNGRELSPIPGVYDWNWSWSSDFPGVASSVEPLALPDNEKLIRARRGITDGHTTLTAKAVITNSSIASSLVGTPYSGRADAYVFICENPWPAPDPNTGAWAPWRDYANNCTITDQGCNYSYNYELYYCRDSGSTGTYDDLPAFVGTSTVVRGQAPLTCSIPDPSGACVATSIGDPCGPNSEGICQTVLKEAYFFREVTPTSTTALFAGNTGVGGQASTTWALSSDPNVDGYRLYYGVNPNSYIDYIEIQNNTDTDNSDVNCSLMASGMECIIDNLQNNQTYYFNLTAFYDVGTESQYFGEKSALIRDSSPPSFPANFTLDRTGDRELELSWDTVTDAASYEIWWSGNNGGPYDLLVNVGADTAKILSRFTNGQEIFLTVRALDDVGNDSNPSNQLTALPFSFPDNLNAHVLSTTEIELNWSLQGAGVQNTIVAWGTTSGVYPDSVSLPGAMQSYIVGGLTPNTSYYFVVRTESNLNVLSDDSNEAVERTNQ